MIKLKNILMEKKFSIPGFNTTMKLFKSKSFQAYAKDRYDININDILNQTEKNEAGMNYMVRDIKDKSIFNGFVMFMLKKNLIK